jgi:NhaP-type Na+/H+ or K+/H+ antiporter
LPNDDVILIVTFVTVGASVFAHGVSAAPLARRYADWIEALPRPDRALLEEQDGPQMIDLGSRTASSGRQRD